MGGRELTMAYKKPKGSRVGKTRDWNVFDDRSGFKIKASKSVTDSEGRVTSKDNFDEVEYNYFVDIKDEPSNRGPFRNAPIRETLRAGAECEIVYDQQVDKIAVNVDKLLLEL